MNLQVRFKLSCKGICKLKFKTIPVYGTASSSDMPMCVECWCRINYTGVRCPCCGTRLRYKTILKSKEREMEIEAKRY